MNSGKDAWNFDADLVELSCEIVAAYVAHNVLPATGVPKLLGDVHSALTKLPQAYQKTTMVPKEPAVAIRRSITADYLACLECGKKFKSLKRHLRTSHDLSPESYRAKWKLPFDYPVVSPNYSKVRSGLAKELRRGKSRSR
jgi:predicted transcriptional regulator